MTIWKIWIHQGFPYVTTVIFNQNENMNHLVSQLNSATKKADLDKLEKDIHVLKLMLDKVEEPLRTYWHLKYLLDLKIKDDPSIEELKSNLEIRLQNLEAIQRIIQSREEVTIDQLPSDLKEEKVINGWFYSLDLEPDLIEFALTEQEVQHGNWIIENYGKAGILVVGCDLNGKVYVQEDENVFLALEEIVSIVFNEVEYLELEEVNSDSKYWQDPIVHKMKTLVEEENENGFTIMHYFLIYVYTNPDFVDENLWKENFCKKKKYYLDQNILW